MSSMSLNCRTGPWGQWHPALPALSGAKASPAGRFSLLRCPCWFLGSAMHSARPGAGGGTGEVPQLCPRDETQQLRMPGPWEAAGAQGVHGEGSQHPGEEAQPSLS